MDIEVGAVSGAERDPQGPRDPLDAYGRVDDELEVGRPPRAPWSRRRRHGLVAVAVVTAAAAALWPSVDQPANHAGPPQATGKPASIAAAPSGPALTPDGTGLLVPTGGTEPLAAAPAAVAAITDRLPTLAAVQGGSPVVDTGHYGLYVAAQAGDDISVIVYAARSPGTTLQVDSYVSRSRFDRTYTNHLDVTAFTGTGWWVRILLTGPGDWQPPTSDMKALAVDPRLLPA